MQKAAKQKYTPNYEKAVEEHFSRLIDNLKWRDNLNKSEDLRQRINKSNDKTEMLTLAIECISAMTCDGIVLESLQQQVRHAAIALAEPLTRV